MNYELMQVMWIPFAASLVLTGIHAYLGLHVVARGVIFVDLALAQVAALGTTCGYFFGFELHTFQSYLISLGFALSAATLFAVIPIGRSQVPHEAYIGITYAVAAACAIVVLSFVPEGGEALKSLLVGHILFVSEFELLKTALVYSALGFILWWARKPLLKLSLEGDSGGKSNLYWNLLFYCIFAVVVTSSVEMAGVLLVFSFLIVPAVCGILLGDSIKNRLIVGWLIGLLASIAGSLVSYYADLPTGATIVCMFAPLVVFSVGLSKYYRLS